MKPPFEWDFQSDQPKVIQDKGFKRRMRKRFVWDYVKMLGLSTLALPAAMTHAMFSKDRPKKCIADIVGVGVSLDKGPQQTALIEELQVHHVLVRLPLWEMDRLDEHIAFAHKFYAQGCSVLINVLQDREHIENPRLLEKDLHRIFEGFSKISSEFQIGNAINRVKWGFFSVKEYLDFFHVAQTIRDQAHLHIKLIGPSVIDFEYPYTVGAIFNRRGIRFDRLSALLYVDRMGAPDNRQYGVFDTGRKMRMLASLAKLAPNVEQKGLYITEVNWPLIGMGAYAPTSPKECVPMSNYCAFMLRYLDIAAATRGVERVYWHQLIAPGYGLIDNRNSHLKKTPAFETLKKLIAEKNV